MRSYHFPRLSLADDLGEVSPQHPITLARLKIINASDNDQTTRRRSLRSVQPTTINPDIDMTDVTQEQPETMAPPQPQTRSSAEAGLSTSSRLINAMQAVETPFVSHIMSELSRELDETIRSSLASGNAGVQVADINSACVMQGSHAIRRIFSSWSAYPHASGSLDGAIIDPTDYRFSATNSVRGIFEGPLPGRIAKSIANFIDPVDIDGETLVHEQKRIDECRLAMMKTYQLWQTRLDPPRLLHGDQLYAELTSEDVNPMTYTMQPPVGGLSKPSTAADMMSSTALAEQAEDEMDDGYDVYVSGGKVLGTKAAKTADLARRLNATRAKEAKEAKEAANTLAATAKPSKKSAAKGANKKKTVLNSSSDHGDVDDLPAPEPVRKSTKGTTRKCSASAMEGDGGENSGSAKAPAPRQKAKKAASKESSKDASSENVSSGSKDRSSGHSSDSFIIVAPDTTRPGGSAPKWLRDEDDLGRRLIMENPDLPMPDVWKMFSSLIANTAYKTDRMEIHDYRSDWIQFPRTDRKGNTIRDKQARKMDIGPRTYESFRQRFEKHKTKVNNPDVPKPFTWESATENPVAHLPKRDPPPRPVFYKDGTTLVDPLTDEASADEPMAEDTPTSTFQGKDYNTSSGWTPINKPSDGIYSPLESSTVPTKKRRASRAKASKGVPQINTALYAQPVIIMQPETPARPGHLCSRPDNKGDDERYDTLEDFVQDQSDGEDNDDDEEPGEAQQSFGSRRSASASGPVISRLPPLSLSRSQGLPSGWESRQVTRRGRNLNRTYYIDHNHSRTTWMSPTARDFNEYTAFGGPNATAPRYQQGYVFAEGEHVPLAAAGLSAFGPSSALNDLAISNLPEPRRRPARAPSALVARRSAAAPTTRTRGSTVGPTSAPRRAAAAPATSRRTTVATSARPSRIVKFKMPRSLSAIEAESAGTEAAKLLLEATASSPEQAEEEDDEAKS